VLVTGVHRSVVILMHNTSSWFRRMRRGFAS
jgi:hypothetical protein